MESGIQSSFIPQDAAQPTRSAADVRSGGLGELVLLSAIVLFVASLALAGAVFLYGQYLSTSAGSKLEQLKRAKEAFEPSLVQELTRLDDRMAVADQVLTAHIAPTALFSALSQSTLSTVSFQSLDFLAADAQHVSLKMSGVAQSVNSIALQADLFSKNGVITNPIFTDINRQADGVHFKLAAVVNPAAINYVQVLPAIRSDQSAAAGAALPPAQSQNQPQQNASPFGPANQ